MVTVASIERYLRPLLNYARGEIRAYEALGALHCGELSPEEIVDEALLEATRRDLKEPAYPGLRALVRRGVERQVTPRRPERSQFEPISGGRLDDDAPGTPRRLVDILPDPTSPIPDQIVESSEFQRALATVLRQLPTDWREPFLLHTRDGLSLHDVAQLEGVSVAEVRHRIDKAPDCPP